MKGRRWLGLDVLGYEVRPGGNRPLREGLWERFDERSRRSWQPARAPTPAPSRKRPRRGDELLV